MLIQTPSENIYIRPKDFKEEDLHYAIVQVSKYRYVVLEYQGSLSNIIDWKIVSKPMSHLNAIDLAKSLKNKRVP